MDQLLIIFIAAGAIGVGLFIAALYDEHKKKHGR